MATCTGNGYQGATPPQRRFERRGITLAALCGVLLVAFFLAPSRIAGAGPTSQGQLSTATRDAVAAYWQTGHGQWTPALADVVNYWYRFHVAKATISALLLVATLTLSIAAWRIFMRRTDFRRIAQVAVGSTGLATLAVALLAGVALLANIQGASAPLSSLLTTLPLGDPRFAATKESIDQALLTYSSSTAAAPLRVMVSDFARYHVVMACLAGIAAPVLAAVAVTLWRHGRHAPGPGRRVRRTVRVCAVGVGLLAVSAGVVCAANISVAHAPAPALLNLFQGAA